jgi:Flp pilus assembly pilin Flp
MPPGRQEGAAAVEFALLLPLLVLLLFGIIEFGFAFSTRIQATNAAREAARLAVVGVDNWANISGSGKPFWQVVKEDAGVGSISNCSVATDPPAPAVGGTLTVRFDFPLNLAIPFLPNPPSWRTGTASASMRIEQLSDPSGPGGC